MISEDSDLYREHPDWAFAIPGRKPVRSRNQLVLDFSRGDVVDYIYDKNNNRYIVTILNVEGVNFTQITFESLFEINRNNWKDFKFFKPNSEMPSTAYDFNDGSGVYKWRDIESFEFVNNNSEVFTNGAHYIHQNINFFLRRQDPYGLYGLNNTNNLWA